MCLCATVCDEVGCDPCDSWNVYVFINRRCTIMRMLHYERGFYVLYEKRSVSGRFKRSVYDSETGNTKSPMRTSFA